MTNIQRIKKLLIEKAIAYYGLETLEETPPDITEENVDELYADLVNQGYIIGENG